MLELTIFDADNPYNQPKLQIRSAEAVAAVGEYHAHAKFPIGAVHGARLHLTTGAIVEVWESYEVVTVALAAARLAAATPSLVLALPWPPSVNHYWRYTGGKPLISKQGRIYRDAVAIQWFCEYHGTREPLTSRLAVDITTHQPDNRERDLDNLQKATLDALQHAGVYLNDSQIDQLSITRGTTASPGSLRVAITEKGQQQ